jgi:two-component system CheB/CheR fusion protein
MIRNLLSNALKYAIGGRVLLGCRRRNGMLSIEVCDTGPGIRGEELHAIFEEYRQLDNAARERSQGLGLGLSIVKGLGTLLEHRVYVRSNLGRGSVFGIELILPESRTAKQHANSRRVDEPRVEAVRRTGEILIIEDDPELRDLLDHLLKDEGYRTAVAPNGTAALGLVAEGAIQPDLILTDFNLPNGMDGLQVSAKLRERLHRKTPVIILTGDISTGTSREIALQNYVKLDKPVKLKELTRAIQEVMALPNSVERVPSARAVGSFGHPVIYVVDDDSAVREAVRDVLEYEGRKVQAYSTCEAFIESYRTGGEACLLIDAYLPGMNGLELLRWLGHSGHRLPAIIITGNSDVPIAVQAMKAGAWDFIEKPIGHRELLVSVENALEQSRSSSDLLASQEIAASAIAGLTPRQRQIMELVLAGHPSKNISADLGISQRTVENHRASIMEKTGSKSLPALARLAFAAAGNEQSVFQGSGRA